MFIYLDTETTGTGPDDRLCQLAFKTGQGTIAIKAMAVHHITNEMVGDKPPFRDSAVYHQLSDLISDDNNIVVAHNARFDIGMLQNEGIDPPRVICSRKN
jgi:DNA polymerase III epsilon subunit-like protein